MFPEELHKFISASVVPVVIISACGLLCLAFYNRLAYIVSRLRMFQREHLEEQEKYARELAESPTDESALRRRRLLIEMLERQTADVSRRAHLIRSNLICLLGTILCLTVCSLATGLSVVWPWAMYIAIPPYVCGALLLVAGIIFAIIEMRGALKPVEFESRFVSRLADELEEQENHAVGLHSPPKP